MKTSMAIAVLMTIGAAPALASTVPVTVEGPALAGVIGFGGIAGSAGGESSPTIIAAAADAMVFTTAGFAPVTDGAAIVLGEDEFGGESFPVDPGAGQPLPGVGDGTVVPVVYTPIPFDLPRVDGGGNSGVVVPLPGAGAMGMAGLLAIGAVSRRRRV